MTPKLTNLKQKNLFCIIKPETYRNLYTTYVYYMKMPLNINSIGLCLEKLRNLSTNCLGETKINILTNNIK